MTAAETRISSTVGEKYRISRFIAEGGMGAVYEAQHLFVRRRFAIKFLRQELTRRRDVIARFKHEAQAAGALEHENIAAVVDFGVAGDGTPYLVMEYLDGSDLGGLLATQGPLPAGRAADLVVQAALGAQAAHDAGLVHRDLKPQNLFVCRRSDGTDLLKLLDFGIAKLQVADAREAVTRTGAVLGTPAYMSPEQARGEPNLDARTDVYSLGVILYELLSGQLPHPGDSHNAVLHHIATEDPLPLACRDQQLPGELARAVADALSRDPSARPASAAALADRLRPFAERKAWEPSNLPTPRESELGNDSTLPALVSVPELTPSPEPPRSEHRAAWRSRVVPLLAVALAAVVTLVVATAGKRPPTATLRDAPTAPLAAPPPLPEEKPIAAPVEQVLPALLAPQASAPARPVRNAERPSGQPSAVLAPAKPQSSAIPHETGLSFDDHNPYK